MAATTSPAPVTQEGSRPPLEDEVPVRTSGLPLLSGWRFWLSVLSYVTTRSLYFDKLMWYNQIMSWRVSLIPRNHYNCYSLGNYILGPWSF